MQDAIYNPIVRISTHGRNRETFTGGQRTMVPVYDFPGKISPCRAACPAGNDIARALFLLASGDLDGAFAAFLDENPFPEITGRVCAHPCEAACNRVEHDAPVAIAALERAAADHGAAALTAPTVTRRDSPIAVVGSGPAGASAAYHLARLGYPVTCFDRDLLPGGALRTGIPRYRLPEMVLDAAYVRLAGLGIEFRGGVSLGSGVSLDELANEFRAVFLAVGRSSGRALSAPGIGEASIETGLDFLRAVNEGKVDRVTGEIAVVGGGDVAIDVARTALRLGATGVQLVSLEARDAMPAHAEEIREAEREGVALFPGWGVERVSRPAYGRLDLVLRKVARLGADLVPVYDDKWTGALVDRIIAAIGQRIAPGGLPEEILANGIIAVDEAGRTSIPDVFAGGDATGTYSVTAAVGAGKRAAIAIDCAINGRDPVAWLRRAAVGDGAVSMRAYRDALDGFDAGPVDVVRIDGINRELFPLAARLGRSALPVDRRDGFAEVNRGLARRQAIAEAARCFSCGACTICGNCWLYCPDSAVVQREDGYFAIDGDHCKGCGQCVRECPRGAMAMVLEKGRA